jgi:serine/threonine protein kinase
MASIPVLSGYDILRPLGGGVLTQVFAARRRSDNASCAIKLPRGEWADHADADRMLRREAQALSAAKHPRIVRLRESHVDHAPPYLVLDLLSGQSLRERLQQELTLDPRAALWISRQIAEGLTALHDAGYVHGDIKPDNVQILDDGSAVLLDLGFAFRPTESESLEADGYVLGTVNYLAPERACRSAGAGFAADWYSFGVMLFEMLAGELPFPLRSVGDVLNHDFPDCVLPPILQAWPERLATLIRNMLERLPAARPRGPIVLHELIALEIAALGRRKAG